MVKSDILILTATVSSKVVMQLEAFESEREERSLEFTRELISVEN